MCSFLSFKKFKDLWISRFIYVISSIIYSGKSVFIPWPWPFRYNTFIITLIQRRALSNALKSFIINFSNLYKINEFIRAIDERRPTYFEDSEVTGRERNRNGNDRWVKTNLSLYHLHISIPAAPLKSKRFKAA